MAAAKTKKSLSDILFEITKIQEGLYYGSIDFTYDRLFSAMGAGHPAEILDKIISDVFWKVRSGDYPTKEEVEKMLKGLVSFKSELQVKEMSKPINHLKTLLDDFHNFPKFKIDPIEKYWQYVTGIGVEDGYIDQDGSYDITRATENVLIYLVNKIADMCEKDGVTLQSIVDAITISGFAGIVASSYSREKKDPEYVSDFIMKKLGAKELMAYTRELMEIQTEEEMQKLTRSIGTIINSSTYEDGIRTEEDVYNKFNVIKDNYRLYCQTAYLYGALIEVQKYNS